MRISRYGTEQFVTAKSDGGTMTRRLQFAPPLGSLALALALAGCAFGPPATGSFERTLDVAGPIRLDLSDTAGDISIEGTSDKKVHIHAQVRVSGFGFESPEKRLAEVIANPPLEQRGDTIRIGKDFTHLHNVSISYVIDVPHDTEVSTTVVSGSETVRGVHGPVKVTAVSGSIHVDSIERDVQLTTVSGSIDANNVNDDVRASSGSGAVSITKAKGAVSANAISGSTLVTNPGGRVEAVTASGSIDVQGANSDVKAHAASGRISVRGNPVGNSYWDLKTASGTVQIAVPPAANFHLSAEAVSGEIRADIPIVVEEQSKHSLRARMGDDGGRVEVHTVSGEIQIRGAS
jgi:putative adhesin